MALSLPRVGTESEEKLSIDFNKPSRSELASSPLSKFLALSRFHDEVQFFATRLAASLTVHPVTGSSPKTPIALTQTERTRIERALYRFEIYCDLFRGDDAGLRPALEERRAFMFEKFLPWEIEQLASVIEYLLRQIDPGVI